MPTDAERARVLVLLLSDIADDARVLRQVSFLTTAFDTTLAAFGKPRSLPENVRFIPLSDAAPQRVQRFAESFGRVALRLGGRYGRAYWLDSRVRSWRSAIAAAMPCDVIVVNDLFGLPLARQAAKDIPVVFDAHEHWTSEAASWTKFKKMSMRRAHEWIVDTEIPRTAGAITVSAGIAREMAARTGVSPVLVTNAPFFQQLTPSAVAEPIRLVHLGLADERRRLEDTIDAVRSANRPFTLDLVLARDNAYRRRLEEMVTIDDRIRILPPVPSSQVIPFLNEYDVGVFLLPARYPNQLHVLPNKLFDYIQARLAVAIGPSPEMAQIVSDWKCGVVSATHSPGSFAEALASLTKQDVERMKARADAAAKVLNAEHNREIVVSLVKRVIDAQRSKETP